MNFPKPEFDTGIGVHDNANCYWKPGNVQEYALTLRAQGITWYLLWVGDENKADYCQYLVEAGIMPIVRFYPAHMPHPNINMAYVDKYIAKGAKWFQLGNEFNLNEEWSSERPKDGPEKTAKWYAAEAGRVRELGGWPLTPPPSLGGHVNHRIWFTRFMEEIARLGDPGQILYPGGIGLHCRSVGNPLEAGPDWYDCSAREWEWFDDVVKRIVGYSLPMANCEAFDEPQWLGELPNHYYKWDLWRDRNLEQMRWFDPDYEGYRYPDYLMCNCFWLIHDALTWNHCGLTENLKYERETGQGRETHLWKTMPNVITWERSGVTPQPPPPPPPPTKMRVYDEAGNTKDYQWAVDKYGILVEQVNGEGWHVTQIRERCGPSNLDIWFYDKNGQPVINLPVSFWWPDGKGTSNTGVDGKVGFPYYRGAYFDPANPGGPHWITVDDGNPFDAVSRLGMIAGTFHCHLDLVFTWGKTEEEPQDPKEIIMGLAEEKLEAIPVPDDWALPKTAVEVGYPIQVGGYGHVDIDNVRWCYQTFTREAQDKYMVCYCKDGEWDKVSCVEVVRD